jgi:O-antigen ligase
MAPTMSGANQVTIIPSRGLVMFDRKRLADIADWEAVMVAVSLPWSTSATSILRAIWLLTVLATLDVAMLRAEVKTAAGGLPALLWLLAAFGLLWADVSWPERIDGLGSFHRLLMIPLLLAQFRRSKNGVWIVYGFFGSAVALLLASWTLWLAGIGQNSKLGFGVPVHDPIAQSTIFLICAFALIWRVTDLLRQRNWRPAMWLAGLAELFLANLVFVANSRGDVVVIPFLVACRLGSEIAGSGWVCSHSARAVVVGSIPAFPHQAASSPERWTSRWCPRQSGTVNSSLTLWPGARDCANRRWWASAGRRPQIRQGCLATDLT